MEVLLGIAGLLFVALFVIVLSMRVRAVAFALTVAMVSRLTMLSVNNLEIWRAPGADADARGFLRLALQWTELSWADWFGQFNLGSSLYAWCGAGLFKLVGPSGLLLQAVSLFFGIVGVFIVFKLAQTLWHTTAAKWAALLVAIYPFAIFNSILTMREEVTIAFFLLGLLMSVRWVNTRSIATLLLAIVSFAVATMFHGGFVAAIIGLLMVVVREAFFPRGVRLGRNVALANISAVVVAFGIMSWAITVTPGLSARVGEVEGDMSARVLHSVEAEFDREATGGSAYPDIVARGDPYRQIWLIPSRILYFLYSPFPWDISTLRQAMGLVGLLVYAALTYFGWRARSEIMERRDRQAVLIIAGFVISAFAIGTTNIGTSLRHRTKVLGALVAVCIGGWTNNREQR